MEDTAGLAWYRTTPARASASSEDHGDINEGRLMGRIRLAYEHVERLKDAIAQRRGAARN